MSPRGLLTLRRGAYDCTPKSWFKQKVSMRLGVLEAAILRCGCRLEEPACLARFLTHQICGERKERRKERQKEEVELEGFSGG